MSTTNPALTLLLIVAACGSSNNAGPDADAARCVPQTPTTAPTYTDLYTKYFAVGKPGHCATDGCHNGANFNIWLCGGNKDTCYQGMTSPASGPLVNPSNPSASLIIDVHNSPLSWFNPNGPMPQDSPGPFPEGAMAIRAWIADCAQNN
ncbi:MAG TPA: hypothetical protein VIX73_22005 [Kofleriaceae bacterium]|jgi:hypothetical protein